MNRGTRAVARLAAVWILTAATAGAQPPPPARTFTDEVEVAEASVVIELPRLGRVAPDSFEPGDFVVEVDGRRRSVVGFASFDAAARPRPAFIWVDAVLSKRETVRLGALALARQARRLVALGPVDVLVDDGAPSGVARWLVGSTEARAVAAALEDVADEELGRDAYFDASARPAGISSYRDVVRRSVDRLLVKAAQGCVDPPCILFWLSDGFPAVDEVSSEAARTLSAGLASYGFVVVSMALHVPAADPDLGVPQPLSYEQWKALTPGVKMPPAAGEMSRLDGLTADSFDFYVEPRYEPLRIAAIASCGAALRTERQLEAEFERIERRLLLRFAGTDAGGDDEDGGSPRFLRVTVRLAEVSRFASRRRLAKRLGLIPPQERLRHGAWIRIGEPPAVRAARERERERTEGAPIF